MLSPGSLGPAHPPRGLCGRPMQACLACRGGTAARPHRACLHPAASPPPCSLACYHLEEYESALDAFQQACTLEPSKNIHRQWLNMCRVQLGGEPMRPNPGRASQGSIGGRRAPASSPGIGAVGATRRPVAPVSSHHHLQRSRSSRCATWSPPSQWTRAPPPQAAARAAESACRASSCRPSCVRPSLGSCRRRWARRRGGGLHRQLRRWRRAATSQCMSR